MSPRSMIMWNSNTNISNVEDHMATIPAHIMTPAQAVELLELLRKAKKAKTFFLDEIEDEAVPEQPNNNYVDFGD
jgi:hypothetical protein